MCPIAPLFAPRGASGWIRRHWSRPRSDNLRRSRPESDVQQPAAFVEMDPAEPEQDPSSAQLKRPQDVSMTQGTGNGNARKRIHGDVATQRQEICRRRPTGTEGDVHVMVRLGGEPGQLAGGGLSECERVHSSSSSSKLDRCPTRDFVAPPSPALSRPPRVCRRDQDGLRPCTLCAAPPRL